MRVVMQVQLLEQRTFREILFYWKSWRIDVVLAIAAIALSEKMIFFNKVNIILQVTIFLSSEAKTKKMVMRLQTLETTEFFVRRHNEISLQNST